MLTQAQAARLGRLIVERYEPEMLMSRAIQICKTWRMHLAWHLANALGWRPARKGTP